MNTESFDQHPDTCGCCQGEVPAPTHENRPGQAALAYRIGTHAAFLQRMLARLSQQEIPDGTNQGQRPLAALTTREPEDPAVALLAAWATVSDVLTFYQERIANEGFLRTATERRSILEMARAIGYELNPGVAASTYLVFKVDESASTPDTATIPAGTQVQSIPAAQGELPQTFETTEEFEARVAWNALQPRTTEPDTIVIAKTGLYLHGVSTQLQPGDAIVIV
ncbi:MAG: putative baseplate assembly protein, partial [Planctomycetaceae bacterium]